MLAVGGDPEPPLEGPGLLFEPKYDGIRAIVEVVGGPSAQARLWSRNGNEKTAQFPDLVTVVELAPGYARALRTNLAVELAPEFGRPPDPVIHQAAKESLADLKRANFPLVEVGIDPALTGGGGSYNILTDG